MHKHIFSLLFIVFLSHFLVPQEAFAFPKVRNVVIFFSLGSNLTAYQNIIEGYKSTFNQKPDELGNLIIEFMDIGRLSNEDHARQIIEMYDNKSHETNFDLLITIGPGINAMLLKYAQNLLKTTPVLNLDIEMPGRITIKDLHVKNGMEVLAKFKIKATLQKAFSLFPAYKNVFVISGSSNVDLFFMSLLVKCKSQFEPEYNFNFISGIGMDSTLLLVKKIPSNSIIIVPNYLSDDKYMSFSTPEALTFISNSAIAPVFCISDVFSKKEGGIGGYVFSYVFFGKEIGRIANEMLDGKPPKDIVVNENSFYQNIYNWQQLKRWKLVGSKAIPANSIFFNKDTSFLELYKWYIAGVIIFIASQTLLILYLYRLHRKQKAITQRSIEAEILHLKLIREDRLSKMTELAASLSHELNQPLTAILYNAQAGNRFVHSHKLTTEQANEIFDNIIEDAKHAGGIISSVRNLMKLETREKERININALVKETVDISHSDFINQSIKVKLSYEAIPPVVFGDKIQIQQVLMNFIRNSVVAMQNTDTENRKIEIAIKSSKDSVEVSVRDSGPGIDEAIKERLFMPFVTTRKTGFGIGLTLSRSIIERHNGEIKAANFENGGAEFSFRLKLVKDGYSR
jgi:signal transduction histidine kinase